MNSAWKKICGLIRKTGDRLVIIDGEEIFVAMDLNNYEKLVFDKSYVKNLTEDELLDRINHDVAVWQSFKQPEERNIEVDFGLDDNKDNEDSDDEDHYYIEPVE